MFLLLYFYIESDTFESLRRSSAGLSRVSSRAFIYTAYLLNENVKERERERGRTRS